MRGQWIPLNLRRVPVTFGWLTRVQTVGALRIVQAVEEQCEGSGTFKNLRRTPSRSDAAHVSKSSLHSEIVQAVEEQCEGSGSLKALDASPSHSDDSHVLWSSQLPEKVQPVDELCEGRGASKPLTCPRNFRAAQTCPSRRSTPRSCSDCQRPKRHRGGSGGPPYGPPFQLDFDRAWTDAFPMLIPKMIGAMVLKKHRPSAVLTAFRKLCMATLPQLSFFQRTMRLSAREPRHDSNKVYTSQRGVGARNGTRRSMWQSWT